MGLSPRWLLSLVDHEVALGNAVGSDVPLMGAGSCSSGSGTGQVATCGEECEEAVTQGVMGCFSAHRNFLNAEKRTHTALCITLNGVPSCLETMRCGHDQKSLFGEKAEPCQIQRSQT